MKKPRSTHAFVSQACVFTLAAICFSGSIGLGTVWMRHQISVTANANKVLEARLAELDRHIAEMEALRTAEEKPAALKLLNASLGLGLVEPVPDKQVQRVSGSAVERLAAKRNREIFNTGVPAIKVRLAQN